jgi:organic hydroperoxide reductase OsmC/OhrA
MLWYLHLCAEAGVIVASYSDHAVGTMEETANGSGRFTEVVLRPQVRIASANMLEAAYRLHAQAHEKCFIANSVNFPVRQEPAIETG